MPDVKSTLNERQTRYGKFIDVAIAAESMAGKLELFDGWRKAEPDQREATRMILQKLARAFSGDPDYVDNWHDIQGYAKLVEDRLNAS